MNLGFKCPLCGSPFFKTISAYDAKPMTRQCRGTLVRGPDERYRGCSYTWTSDLDRRNGLENYAEPQK